MERILTYLNDSIESFNIDPADTDFQRGYLSAIEQVQRFTLSVINEDNEPESYQGADGYEHYVDETPLDTPSLDNSFHENEMDVD